MRIGISATRESWGRGCWWLMHRGWSNVTANSPTRIHNSGGKSNRRNGCVRQSRAMLDGTSDIPTLSRAILVRWPVTAGIVYCAILLFTKEAKKADEVQWYEIELTWREKGRRVAQKRDRQPGGNVLALKQLWPLANQFSIEVPSGCLQTVFNVASLLTRKPLVESAPQSFHSVSNTASRRCVAIMTAKRSRR